MEGIAQAEKKEHIYLGRANAQLEHVLRNRLYRDFDSMIRDMRGTQWGWGDFIDLFSLVNKVAVVTSGIPPGGIQYDDLSPNGEITVSHSAPLLPVKCLTVRSSCILL